MSVPYRITRLEEAEACVMPVRRGSEGDCHPGPLGEPDDRSELCATDAWWLLGDLALCDQHLRVALEVAGDSYAAMLARYRSRFPALTEEIPSTAELLPWSQRPRRPERVRRGGAGSAARWRRSPGWPASARVMRRRAGR
jgi:hypothetical protein